jgi:N-succinyldiaminopimelate aminotransferase
VNHYLEKLHPYPFERFNQLLEGVETSINEPLIAWSLGEPKHPAPEFIIDSLREVLSQGLGTYPPTKGMPELRTAIADFIQRRFNLPAALDSEHQVLPVNGTREGLFAIAQSVIDPAAPGLTMMPNPFYQIYEGAALLAGSEPRYMNCTDEHLPDFAGVTDQEWERCKLLYICTPGNPSGAVIPLDQLKTLINLSDEHDFIIASDECYSEIYDDEQNPPVGLLEAASALGRHDYKNCIAFNSLSKRSNLPGMRSGYVAGDAEVISKFLLYRTYHGSAMPVHHQIASTKAWQDDSHVVANRDRYRQKFNSVLDILSEFWPMERPEGGFYLWPETPIRDTDFAVKLIELANVKVLPGTFLSRETAQGNPGANRVRMALVATESECVDAALRIRDCWSALAP